jgi:PAS domain S-box-containing protein
MKSKVSENNMKALTQLQDKPAADEFLIVGIGASAGGIQALKKFFQNVSKNSGLAYVVILHLSPDHDSKLAELLQHDASLPVLQVKEKVRIDPDHIYVIPPDQHLEVKSEFITVSKNLLPEDRRAPVDIFFRSMAEEYGPRAIAVILSGTGANGSMGLKRVKERGGACFVQNPLQAEFNEMPRNAIATDLVDEILPVEEIPHKIATYKNSLAQVDIGKGTETLPEDQALREILNHLKIHTSHDFTNYKRPTLLRRIERRINIHNLDGLPAYSEFLQENSTEPAALLKDLLISVTNFFRDKKPFEVLEYEVLPILFKNKKSGDQVRIWVPGCATGEEAYSIAMVCAEISTASVDAPDFQIFATDIDGSAISKARDGCYTINDATDVSSERLRRFFNKEGEKYRIKREIREKVMFAVHNFLKDPPFSHLDLISCRNVLIYLNKLAQDRVMETFHFALNPGAFLFLGTSESVDGASDLYFNYNRENHIFQRRQISMKVYPVPESTPVLQNEKFKKDSLLSQQQEKKIFDRISYGDLHQQLLEEYAPPSLVVNEEYDIMHLSKHAGRYLQITGGGLSKNLLKLIRPELRLELRSALYQSTRRQSPVEARDLHVIFEDHTEIINILIRPVLQGENSAKGFILVLFEPVEEKSDRETLLSSDEPLAKQLEEELIRAKAQLKDVNQQHDYQAEEMKAANEELQAMNEELRSAAEELETSKEELQSINEELRTVNQELKVKIEETSLASNNLHNIINSTDIGTIFLDKGFRVDLYTPAATLIFNLIPADYGRPLSDITNKLHYQDLLADAKSVLENLVIVEKEVSTTEDRTYLMRVLPYRTDEDRINGVIITFVDITDRKSAEEALRKAEEKYRIELENKVELRTKELKASRDEYLTLVENTPDVITRWNRNLQLVYANPAFGTRTGIKNELVLGMTNSEMGQPDDISIPFEEALKRTFKDQIMVEHFDSFHTAEGITYFHSRLTPEKDASGNVTTVLSVAREITDLKNNEVKIRLGGEFLKSVLDSSLDAIQVFKTLRDNSGKIIDFVWQINNLKAVEQNGEVIGQSLLKKNPGFVNAGIFAQMVEVVETGKPSESTQYYSFDQFKDRWFYQAIVRQGDGLVMTTRDITDQIAAEKEMSQLKEELAKRAAELEQSNEDLRQFAHVTSHDLKEPVRKITTFYSRIIHEYQEVLPKKAIEYLERIRSASTRMSAMIEGVLHYSKVDSLNDPLEKVNLEKTINRIITDLEVLIEMKKAKITCLDLSEIEGHPILIYQLFYNLIINALKFVKKDVPPQIVISGSKVEKNGSPFFQVKLNDNGIGFKQQFAEEIFSTFTRLNPSDEYEGSGIGLALCKKIVERHNGFISATGIPNEGAEFKILFPISNL